MCEIPQGTILGPNLFVIYIYDLPRLSNQFVKIFLFADDARLYKHVTSEEDHQSLQVGLKAIQCNWQSSKRRSWINTASIWYSYMILPMATYGLCYGN